MVLVPRLVCNLEDLQKYECDRPISICMDNHLQWQCAMPGTMEPVLWLWHF